MSRRSVYTLMFVVALLAMLFPAAPLVSGQGEGFRIGLVTDVGEVDDRSFNQSAWEGVQAVVERYGGEARYIETQDSTDYADNIAEFAENGYDIIVTVGFALGEATVAAAAEYPEVHFIGVDQFQAEVLPNVTGLVFPEDQAGYLAGVLAARLTQSGVIAGVYGTDLVPPVGRGVPRPGVGCGDGGAGTGPGGGRGVCGGRQDGERGADGGGQPDERGAPAVLHRGGHRPVVDGAGGASLPGVERDEADPGGDRADRRPDRGRGAAVGQLLWAGGAGSVPRL